MEDMIITQSSMRCMKAAVNNAGLELQEVLLAVEERRQLSVHVLGRKERSKGPEPPSEPPGSAQNGGVETSPPEVISEQSSSDPSEPDRPELSSNPEPEQPADSTVQPSTLASLPTGTQHADVPPAGEPSSGETVQQLPSSGADGQRQNFSLIDDIWAFKRGQACFASSGGTLK